MKYINIVILIFLSVFLLIANGNQPPQKISCTNNTCSLYALTTQGSKLITSGKKSDIAQYSSAWIDQKNNLAGFSISCGTACSYSYFVDYQTGQVSDNMYLVEDVNVIKRIVVLPNPSDNNDQSLLVRPIFGCNKGIVIKRNFDPDVENGIQDIAFDKNGNLYMDYYVTPNNTEVKETIPIDYAKIANICSSQTSS